MTIVERTFTAVIKNLKNLRWPKMNIFNEKLNNSRKLFESVFPWWDLWHCQVNTKKRKSKEIFVGFGRCLWLRMCYLGETCGIVKWIPESASHERSSLDLEDVYLWDWIINNNNNCVPVETFFIYLSSTPQDEDNCIALDQESSRL